VNLTTFTSRAAAALVAGVAGVISYQHIVSVAESAGEHRSAAVLIPLAIDGLIVVATLAMIDDKRNGRVPRPSARFALAFGILATVSANIASAQPSWTARAVAVVPALSFLIAVEVLARTGRPVTAEPDPGDPPSASQDAPEPPARARAPRKAAARRSAQQRVVAARSRHPEADQAVLAKRARVSLRSVARYDPGPAPGPNHREHDQTPELSDVTG